MMGLRLGDRPKCVVTTTPRPVPLLRRVIALEGTVMTRGRMDENVHLPRAFVAQMRAMYGGGPASSG
jgi:phage terminase large subunit-like protein